MDPIDEVQIPQSQGETIDYVFDMLRQLAMMAEECGETGIARILNTMVASRGPSFEVVEKILIDGRFH